LIDDGIDGNGSFAGLPVTDDQLALTAPIGIMASMALMPV